jgi:hypothetical protein
MVENVKLLLSIILAMIEALPQDGVDDAGKPMKIPDAEYVNLISAGVAAMATGAGFQIPGLTDSQFQGSIKGIVLLCRAWKAAVRVAA